MRRHKPTPAKYKGTLSPHENEVGMPIPAMLNVPFFKKGNIMEKEKDSCPICGYSECICFINSK